MSTAYKITVDYPEAETVWEYSANTPEEAVTKGLTDLRPDWLSFKIEAVKN